MSLKSQTKHKKRAKSLKQTLIEDCITHRLTYEESKDYVEKRLGAELSRTNFFDWKRKINSDDTLDIYFNEHTRIGFVKNQRDRYDEAESVMATLMRQWGEFRGKSDPDIGELCRLADTIISVNKRMEDISMSNPVISKIKTRIEIVESESESRQDLIQR